MTVKDLVKNLHSAFQLFAWRNHFQFLFSFCNYKINNPDIYRISSNSAFSNSYCIQSVQFSTKLRPLREALFAVRFILQEGFFFLVHFCMVKNIFTMFCTHPLVLEQWSHSFTRPFSFSIFPFFKGEVENSTEPKLCPLHT